MKLHRFRRPLGVPDQALQGFARIRPCRASPGPGLARICDEAHRILPGRSRSPADPHHGADCMAERSFASEVQDLKLGEGAVFRGEGILAITKALLQSGGLLCRRLPGFAHLAPDGRAGRCQGRARRSRCSFRILGLGSRRRRDAVGLRALSRARRGHMEVDRRDERRIRRAVEPVVGRRQGRRPDRDRRGLRGRLLDHAGAQPRLRDEIADVAARSPARPRMRGQGGRGRLRAVGSLEHAGDARGAHPHLATCTASSSPRTTSVRPSR